MGTWEPKYGNEVLECQNQRMAVWEPKYGNVGTKVLECGYGNVGTRVLEMWNQY